MKPFRAGVRFALLLTVLAALPAFASEKPINLSIFPPIAIAKPEDSVTAFRFNLIYGKNTSVKVIDLGLVNHTTSGLSNGLQWATVNYAENAGGLQLAMVNYARKMDGVQVGVVNIIKEGGMFPVMVIANWGK
jgi:hypothetical protein